MKYLIKVSYDGSKFYGFQKLIGKDTVQGRIEKVLETLEQKPVKLISASRTDKGVHSIGQICLFKLDKEMEIFRLKYYLNRMLKPSIFISDCKIIYDDNFHPRFTVHSKTYVYKINVGAYNAILNDYCWNLCQNISIRKMNKCKKLFLGKHNYKAFVVGKHKTYESEIYKIGILKKQDKLQIEITGKAFYTYMVRNIVAVLVLLGTNKIDDKTVQRMLDSTVKLIEYSPAPANGLYLKSVNY